MGLKVYIAVYRSQFAHIIVGTLGKFRAKLVCHMTFVKSRGMDEIVTIYITSSGNFPLLPGLI